MSIESTLRTFLLTSGTLTALIASRLYYLKAPQEVTIPYVVYMTLDDPNTKTLVGSDGANPSISFRIVAANATSMMAVSEALRAKIIDFTGIMGATDVYRIECQNIRDFPPETDTDYFERYCDYQIAYER
jgi:hypothetical protein